MKNILLVLLCISLFNCKFEEESPIVDTTPADNYIKQYCYLLNINPDYRIISSEENLTIDDFDIIPFTLRVTDNNSDYITNVDRDELKDLAAKNNDTTFKGSMALVFPGKVSVNSLTQIDIVTNSDYNDYFKSGDNINSIIEITYMDPKSYIDNGYRFDNTSNEQEISIDLNKMTFTTNLNEFNKVEHQLIALDILYLKLKEQPTVDGEYKFTITYTDNKGNKITGTTPVIPIKVKRD